MNGHHTTAGFRPLQIIALLLGIAALYLARDVLVPTALAVLLTFLLAPLVRLLQKWRIPRVYAVAITVCLAVAFTITMVVLVTHQVIDLTAKLPDYNDNLKLRVRELRSSGTQSWSRVFGTFRDLKQEFATTQSSTPSTTAAAVPVQIVNAGFDFFGLTSSVIGSFYFPLTQAGITLLLLIFLLLHNEDVRDRLVWLAGMRQISLTTAAMEEVSERISKYLRTQFLINLIYGIMIAIGLAIFSVPNAMLWGVFAGVLRFVPFVGPWIAGILPTLLTIAAFPGWSRPIGVISMFAGVELFTNLVLEPWLYASSTGISSLGVVCATVFWAWLWGPVGLILAVPITVCLAVLGKHVPQFALIHYLIWKDAAVPLVGRLYQRLLVGDEIAVEQLLDEQMKDVSFNEMCDTLLLPVLQQLKRDQALGLIDPAQVHEALALTESTCALEVHEKPHGSRLTLLSVGAQNDVDDAAARLLSCAAEKCGIKSEPISSRSLASEIAARADESGATWVAIVQVAPISRTHTRHLLKVLGSRLGNAVKLVELSIDAKAAQHELRPVRSVSSTEGVDVEVRRETAFAPMLARLGEMTYSETKPDVHPSAA